MENGDNAKTLQVNIEAHENKLQTWSHRIYGLSGVKLRLLRSDRPQNFYSSPFECEGNLKHGHFKMLFSTCSLISNFLISLLFSTS